jgi:hypothetical protein
LRDLWINENDLTLVQRQEMQDKVETYGEERAEPIETKYNKLVFDLWMLIEGLHDNTTRDEIRNKLEAIMVNNGI